MENKLNINNLDKLAYLSIKRGVALQKCQNLLITAPIESLPLVRKICEHAYKEGAGIVTPLFSDSDITLSRFKYASNESWSLMKYISEILSNLLEIYSSDPYGSLLE